MKFGEYLRENKIPEWDSFYLDYDLLKKLIKELENFATASVPTGEHTTSLTTPEPTNASGMPVLARTGSTTSHERFYAILEKEMGKIQQFTKRQVEEIRRVLHDVEGTIGRISSISDPVEQSQFTERLKDAVVKAGEDFLR